MKSVIQQLRVWFFSARVTLAESKNQHQLVNLQLTGNCNIHFVFQVCETRTCSLAKAFIHVYHCYITLF